MKRKHFFISFLFIAFLLGVTAYLFFSPLLKVTKVLCTLDEVSCPDYLQAELEKNIGKSFFFTRYDLIAENIVKKQPSLQLKAFTKKIGGEIIFQFQQTQPIFALKPDQYPFFLIDSQGMVIATAEQTQLPYLFFHNGEILSLGLGTQLPEALNQQLKLFFAELQHVNIPFSQITLVNSGEVEIQTTSGKKAVLSLDKSQVSLAQLDYVLHHEDQLKLKAPFHVIDLRFKYPVLKP
jgi:hypothetical protein